jgi:hypothetical protein
MLVHVQRIGLLREVIRAHRTTHLRCLILRLSNRQMLKTQVVEGVGENLTQNRIRRILVRQALTHPQACPHLPHRVYVAVSSFFRLLWSVWRRRFLVVHDGICEAREVRKHYGTRVHIRLDWTRRRLGRRATQTYGR